MIVKTPAIVLHFIPFSETSRIVVWLTERYGKISTLIKGSQRPKSMFLGQFDLFYTCELLVYLRTVQTLHIVRECTPLKIRLPLRYKWRAASCASYFASIVSNLSPQHARQRQLFHWLDSLLDIISQTHDLERCLYWSELKLLTLMGATPRLSRCVKCNAVLPLSKTSKESYYFFSAKEGGAYCSKCGNKRESGSFKLSLDTLGVLRFWEQAGSWDIARKLKCAKSQLQLIDRLLGAMLQYHLELPIKPRQTALECLHSKVGGEKRKVS